MQCSFAQLLPAPVGPKTKLSTLTGRHKNEVVYPDGLAKGGRAGAVHGPARGPSKWHVAHSVLQLREVYTDAAKLQVRIAVPRSGWIYTGFSDDDLPNLGSNSALSV